jgi:uncharacterized protein (DUF433 family)
MAESGGGFGMIDDARGQQSFLEDRVVRDPAICGGEAVFRGTRVTLRTVLASLADGDDVTQIVTAFPTLTPEDVRATIAFAAASAEEDLPVAAVPSLR